MAEFASKFPRTFKRWKKKSGYIISLAVKDLPTLDKFIGVLSSRKIPLVKFYEPDIGQVTAIAIAPHPEADRMTRRFHLAGKVVGSKDKNSS